MNLPASHDIDSPGVSEFVSRNLQKGPSFGIENDVHEISSHGTELRRDDFSSLQRIPLSGTIETGDEVIDVFDEGLWFWRDDDDESEKKNKMTHQEIILFLRMVGTFENISDKYQMLVWLMFQFPYLNQHN